MGIVFALIYLAGLLGSVAVGRHRAGITQRGRLSFMTALLSPVWFGQQLLCMFFWPVFLVIWLVKGRPESNWESFYGNDGVLRVRRAS